MTREEIIEEVARDLMSSFISNMTEADARRIAQKLVERIESGEYIPQIKREPWPDDLTCKECGYEIPPSIADPRWETLIKYNYATQWKAFATHSLHILEDDKKGENYGNSS